MAALLENLRILIRRTPNSDVLLQEAMDAGEYTPLALYLEMLLPLARRKKEKYIKQYILIQVS
jgi:hypothetical protein